MSSSKGKGRATHDQDIAHDQNQSSESSHREASFLSRFVASASGLSQSAFSTPSSNELNDRAAAALANAGKGQSSSSGGGSAWVEGSNSHQSTIQASGSGALRAGHNEEHVRQAESEFSSFLDDIPSFTSSEVTVGRSDLDRESMGIAWTRSQPTKDPVRSDPTYRTIAEQENHDGEEVLAILSEPGGTNAKFETLQEDEENYDWGLSSDQTSELRAMTKDMFPPLEPHAVISPDNPLNLVPKFEGPGPNEGATQLDSHLDNSYMYFGTPGQQTAAREMWRKQWDDVLTRYADEVWGGLLPLVKDARREVEDLRNNDLGTQQPKALRRLGAILGHLRKH